MKRLFIGLVPVVLLGLTILVWASCKQATEVDQTSCANNSEPFLGKLYFEINGDAAAADSLQLTTLDVLGISYQYIDYECNLDGGKIYFKVDSQDWEVVKILPDGTPCSSNDANDPVGFETSFPALDVGEHTFRTGWVDNCGIRSVEKEGAFTILGAADDDDDDDDDDTTGDWGLIFNGGFENGRKSWNADPAYIIQDTNNLPRVPYEGDWAAYFHGISGAESILWQGFEVPASATNLKLTLFYFVRTEETSGATQDVLAINFSGVAGDPVFENFGTISNLNQNNNYQKFTSYISLDATHNGQRRYLSFQAAFDEDEEETEIVIDNVTLTAE